MSNDTRKTSTVISPTRDSKYFGQKASMRSIQFGRSVSVHAEVTSMSAQFIISRPLTPPVYWGPRIKKAHSEHTEKGKRSAVRALNIQLDKGWRGWGRGCEARWSRMPVLHVTLLISCLTDYMQLNRFKCCCGKKANVSTLEGAMKLPCHCTLSPRSVLHACVVFQREHIFDALWMESYIVYSVQCCTPCHSAWFKLRKKI